MKIARLVYHMLKLNIEYQASGAAEYDQRFREREITYLHRKAAKLGFTLARAPNTLVTVS